MNGEDDNLRDLIATYMSSASLEDRAKVLRLLHVTKHPNVGAEVWTLACSENAAERAAAADIAAQRDPAEDWPRPVLRRLLNDSDPDVIAAAATGLFYTSDSASLDVLRALGTSRAASVRDAIAFAFGNYQGQLAALNCLLQLKDDAEASVRISAVISLGIWLLAGDKRVVEALLSSCSDPDAECRGEAILALAESGEPSILPYVRNELAAPFQGCWAVDAAAYLADPSLCEPLQVLLSRLNEDDKMRFASSFNQALSACCARE
jgi:HEAT repeat protein